MQTVKPVYRIGAAGLDPRDWRLIEIVFKHSQYNRFEFVLAPGADPESIDILIANTNDAEGVRAVSAVRTGTRSIPVIAAVPRGAPGAARHAISIDRLTLQLLPILNRVVELELRRLDEAQSSSAIPTGSTRETLAGSDGTTKQTALNSPAKETAPAATESTAVLQESAVEVQTMPAESGLERTRLDPSSVKVDVGPAEVTHAKVAEAGFAQTNVNQTNVAQTNVAQTNVPKAKSAGLSLAEMTVAALDKAKAVSSFTETVPVETSAFDPQSAFRTRQPNPASQPVEPISEPATTEQASHSSVPQAGRNSTRPTRIQKLDLPTSPVNLKSVPGAAEDGPVAVAAANDAGDPGALSSNLFSFPKSNLSPPAPQQLRVLVVDDSPTVRQQLTDAVHRMGLACSVVGSGAEALRCLEEQYFDLILLDVVMPDMDGYKLTRLIKRNRQLRQIPVVLLTSRSSAFDLARGALAGCDTYLVKPVTLLALETAVFKQLRNSLAIDDLSAMLRPTVAEPSLVLVTPSKAPENTSSPRVPDDQSHARR